MSIVCHSQAAHDTIGIKKRKLREQIRLLEMANLVRVTVSCCVCHVKSGRVACADSDVPWSVRSPVAVAESQARWLGLTKAVFAASNAEIRCRSVLHVGLRD